MIKKLILLIFTSSLLGQVEFKVNENKIDILFSVPKDEYIYEDYINISVDHPDASISDWHANVKPVEKYDQSFKKNKIVFDKDFKISLEINSLPKNTGLHVSYLISSSKAPIEKILQLNPEEEKEPKKIDTYQSKYQKKTEIITPSSSKIVQYREHISSLINRSKSPWFRIIFILLLGILLSLTPCIYPMIPITLGVLQSQQGKSVLRNFLTAFSYTLGISTTFAILGLIAAISGRAFGSLSSNPIFIVIISALFIYLGLSMLGLYEIYIPKFLQPKETSVRKGSIVSAFIFGAISGTVASPCLSPGLALVLGLVTTMANKFLGFLYLFTFGIGISLPLLIIGTFSSSINIMPKAGEWMVEIKKIFGLLMLGTSIYFINSILPSYIAHWLVPIFVLSCAIYLFKPTNSKLWNFIKSILGITLTALAVVMFARVYKEQFLKKEITIVQTNYQVALEKAKSNDKKLLVDFWSRACSLCKALDKQILNTPVVIKALNTVEFVKLDGFADINQKYLDRYEIKGFPTLLLINPNDESLIKAWNGELLDNSPEEFVKELSTLI